MFITLAVYLHPFSQSCTWGPKGNTVRSPDGYVARLELPEEARGIGSRFQAVPAAPARTTAQPRSQQAVSAQ